MVDAYPLAWPPGRPRTSRPEASRFRVSQDKAQRELLVELRALGASGVVVSTNVPLRRDGLPYASRRPPEDQGVAVYFVLRGRQLAMACDRWETIGDNMRAIGQTIAALRGIARWGSGDMVTAAFSGFVALPPGRSWWQVLGVDRSAPIDDVRRAYRGRLREVHPDVGGTREALESVQRAWGEAMIEKGGSHG